MEKIYLVQQRNVLRVSKSGKIIWSDWTTLCAYFSFNDAIEERNRLIERSEKFVAGFVDYRVCSMFVR